MTDDKKALADLPGFRVGSDGVVEALTGREVDVLIARVIREAIEKGLWVRGALHWGEKR
jgi:hypothetical protein